jgi:hypothetical protein
MSFSYPINPPRIRTKREIAQYFVCSRGGGQTNNAGITDTNYLAAYFLEKDKGNLTPAKEMIDLNRQSRGWLIFATHDVDPRPTPYGCTPEFFAEVVEYAVRSGARLLPVIDAFEVLMRRSSEPAKAGSWSVSSEREGKYLRMMHLAQNKPLLH